MGCRGSSERDQPNGLVPLRTSPLEWWKDNEHTFPVLACMARGYLSIPATSVPIASASFQPGESFTSQMLLSQENVDDFDARSVKKSCPYM